MKKVIITILMIITLSCNEQQIIPLEKMIEYRDSDTQIPDGAYLKDVNGLLDKYILGRGKELMETKIIHSL